MSGRRLKTDGSAESTQGWAHRSAEPAEARRGDPRVAIEELQHATGNRAVRQVLEALGDPAGRPRGVPAVVRRALAAGDGRPLDAATQAFMESKFHQDLGDVRIHTGSQADEASRLLGARAYTTGREIAFRTGLYAPDTAAGRHLLAHELAHVLQARGTVAAPTEVAEPGSATEAGADRAAAAVNSGQSPALATGVPAAVRLAPDPKLEGYLKAVSDAIRRHTSIVGPINEDELLKDIFAALGGLDLTQVDNLGPIARTVRALTPSPTFVRFLRAVQSLPQQREAHVRRTVENLPIPRRGGPWGTYGPATPAFAAAEVIGRPLAPYVLPVVEVGGNVLGFVEGVVQGLTEELANQLTDKDLKALQDKLMQSSVVAAALPPLMAVAAVHGIGKQLIEAVEGIIDIVKDPMLFLKNIGALLEAMVSEGGKDMGRALGADVGAQSATDIKQSIKKSAVGFTYDFGKLVGPIVVWAVLTLVGLSAVGIAVKVVKELTALAKKSKTVAKIIEWLKSLKRAKKLLPEKKHVPDPKKLPDPKRKLPDPEDLPEKGKVPERPTRLPPKEGPPKGLPKESPKATPKESPKTSPKEAAGREGQRKGGKGGWSSLPVTLSAKAMKAYLQQRWKNGLPILKTVSELHRKGSTSIAELEDALFAFIRQSGLKGNMLRKGGLEHLPASNPMSLSHKLKYLTYEESLLDDAARLRGNLVHEVAAHAVEWPHKVLTLPGMEGSKITAIMFMQGIIEDGGDMTRVFGVIDTLAGQP